MNRTQGRNQDFFAGGPRISEIEVSREGRGSIAPAVKRPGEGGGAPGRSPRGSGQRPENFFFGQSPTPNHFSNYKYNQRIDITSKQSRQIHSHNHFSNYKYN